MKNGTQGFTLIELLIVIAIIGILAAVLIPNLLGARKRAYDTASLNCAKQIQAAQVAFQGDKQRYADNGTTDKIDTDLTSNCLGDVTFGTTKPTDLTTAGDSKINIDNSANPPTYSTYVWNKKGSKSYLVNQTNVQAQ